MKKKICCVMLGALLLTGCNNNMVETSADLKTVSITELTNESYEESVNYTGFVSADEVKRFSFELSGKINDVLVEEGEEIKEGQVLATLDTTTVQMAIDNANEDIKMAQNQIAQIDKGIEALNLSLDAENVTLTKAKTALDAEKVSLEKIKQTYLSNINTVQLTYDNALETFNNISALYDKGVSSKTDYDNAKLQLDTYKEQLDNAKKTMENDIALQEKNIDAKNDDITLQETSIKNTENEIQTSYVKRDAANIKLEQAKIALEQNTKYLTDSTLKSTINGYVMTINLHAGEVTSAGTPVVIVKSGDEVINIGVGVDDYSKLKEGMSAVIDSDGEKINGQITTVSLYPDESTRTYNVKVRPEKQDLAMGSLVNVKIPINQKNGCFVPLNAVQNIDGVDYVYSVDKDENDNWIVTRIEVTLGESDGSQVMAENLSPGTKIINSEIKDITENQIVNVAE